MKKVIISLALASAAICGGFNAGANGAGGAQMSVAQALAQKDDAHVVLVGKITKQIKHDKYEFTDGKDAIIAEIDDKIWRVSPDVTPNDTIRIEGFIDKEAFEKTEVEVKKIEIVK